MANIINPKVTVIDYGPKFKLLNGQEITPDEFVWGASRIAYKDIGTIPELLELKRNEKDISETIKKSLINSAGAGHASMATTPGFWAFLEGNSSKMVDSMFTGARFASSLMPSGRRVPIEVDKIVIPKKIHEHPNKDFILQLLEKIFRLTNVYKKEGFLNKKQVKLFNMVILVEDLCLCLLKLLFILQKMQKTIL